MAADHTPTDVPRAGPMPRLGIGTWQNDDPEQCTESVHNALEIGYRHVDTAQAYGNEAAVGDGIAAADVPRDDVFLATKVWITELGYDDVIQSTEESLQKLGVDHVDLLYVHWPAGEYDAGDTLPAFAELRDRGLIDHIGVSNFEPHHLEEAQAAIDDPIFANQIELHPFLQQHELREYAEDNDVELVAYSPLARGGVFENETLQEIAARHDVSAAQVALAWCREIGVTAIPKATSRAHIEDNWASLACELDQSDLDEIAAIDHTDRRVEPDFAPAAWD